MGSIEPRHLVCEPLERSRNLAAAFYGDAQIADLERSAIFASAWQLVGHSSQVTAPGDYFTTTIGKVPLIICRDDDGVVRGFHNVCRHRGGPVACNSGSVEHFRCQYHGWRYSLNGQLLEATDFGEAEHFVTDRVHLRSIAIHEWRGLLFAHPGQTAMSPEIPKALESLLSDGHPLETYRFARSKTYRLDCNWKIYVDNYLEGYHVPELHPGLNAQLVFNEYTAQVFDECSVQHSPLQCTITRGGAATGSAVYIHLFPNQMLNCLPGRLQTNRIVPVTTSSCDVIFDYYYADDVTEEDRKADQDSAHQTQLEDQDICAIVQRNMESGAYISGRLSPKWEEALWAFQNWYRERVGAALPRQAETKDER